MSNLLLIIGAVLVGTGFIYFVFTALNPSTEKEGKKELQITHKNILQQVEILYDKKKYDIVETLARKYLQIKPRHYEVRFVLAKTYFNQERIYDAMRELFDVLAVKTTFSSAKLLLGRCYMKIGQPNKAINELKDVLKFDEDNYIAVELIAQLYVETNQKISAIKMYKKLEETLTSNSEVANNKKILASLYIEVGDYAQAFDELNIVLENYPEDEEVNKQLIQLYKSVGNYRTASELCEKLLELNPNNNLGLWTLDNLVNLSFLLKDVDKTLEYAQKLLDHPFSDKIKTKIYIAKLYLATGKENEGLEILKELSEDNEENIQVKKDLAEAYSERGEFSTAVEMYKEILDLVPPQDVDSVHRDMSNLFVKWAMKLFDKKEYNECFKIFTLAIQYDDTNSYIFYKLGQANKEIKNYGEAITQFKKAIELESGVSKYYMELSECYGAIDNLYEQKLAILSSLKYDDANAAAHYKLANLYEKQHDIINQTASLRRVIELDKGHAKSRHKLALILESQGHLQEAQKLYQQILEKDPTNERISESLKMIAEKLNND